MARRQLFSAILLPTSTLGHFTVDILDDDGNNLSVLLVLVLAEIYLTFIRVVAASSLALALKFYPVPMLIGHIYTLQSLLPALI